MKLFFLTFTFDDLRAVLEVMSFLATVALGALGFFVLSQLKIAKQTLETTNAEIQTRIKREAIVLAAQQADRFSEIIDELSNTWDMILKNNIKAPEWELNNDLFDLTSISRQKESAVWLSEIGKLGLAGKLVNSLNQHESFAIYFVGGAADEVVVFDSIATTYCSHVRKLSPLLIQLRYGRAGVVSASGPYRNLIELYVTWNSRLMANQLEREKKSLEDKRAGIHTSEIPIYGAERKNLD